MELPQPRAFGTDGRKTTHDFLSLYSPAEQDPRPLQGGWLRTHDFLQPLEQAEKSVEKEEGNVEVRLVEKPPLPAAPLPSMDHGGIGSYIISHLQGVSKLEGSLFSMAQPSSTDMNDENSNSSSYTGSGFTLWEESVVKKGKTGKENNLGERRVLGETGLNTGGQHPAMMEWASQSSSNLRQLTAQNNQSFLNMLASARSGHEEDDEEEEEEEFVIKKEQSPYPKVTSVGKSNDQKQNTPRSKHSATEQRRRSKINDRFQMLRGIIPHSDQKRDKASFLLEVIEYIQFLQEKVQKYEGSYQGWEHEPTKFPWNKCQRGARAQPPFINNTSDPTQMFASKFADSKPGISRTAPLNGWKAEPETSTCLMNNSSHTKPFNPNIFRYCGTSSNGASQVLPKVVASERDKPTPQQHQSPQFHVPNYAAPSHESKDPDPPIESGTISISSTYSQGLLSSLTHALQSAGVDLSQACISVHIDLGKRANGRLISPAIKGDHVSTSNEPILQSTLTNTGEESGQARKRIKTSRN